MLDRYELQDQHACVVVSTTHASAMKTKMATYTHA